MPIIVAVKHVEATFIGGITTEESWSNNVVNIGCNIHVIWAVYAIPIDRPGCRPEVYVAVGKGIRHFFAGVPPMPAGSFKLPVSVKVLSASEE